MAKRNRCKCGKVISKYSHECSTCYLERIRPEKEANLKIVSNGVCPLCGGKLKRNLSLAGWWQCEQIGAEIFRKDPSKPSCSFQLFV